MFVGHQKPLPKVTRFTACYFRPGEWTVSYLFATTLQIATLRLLHFGMELKTVFVDKY